LGGEYLEKMTKEKQIKRYLKRLSELGVDVEIARGCIKVVYFWRLKYSYLDMETP